MLHNIFKESLYFIKDQRLKPLNLWFQEQNTETFNTQNKTCGGEKITVRKKKIQNFESLFIIYAIIESFMDAVRM